jgi:MFS transporter, ACS family, tartrate transporter
MNTTTGQESFDPIATRTRRRIMRRLVPFLFILYVFNYMGRVNIGYAALQLMGDLHFSNAVFGFGSGIFFIGYFLFQIPQTMLVEVWSARKFLGLALLFSGGLSIVMGMIVDAHQFYWVRFLLGIAEAGFFPGVIVYITHWYIREDRAKAVAMFYAAVPASNMVGAGLAAWLMTIHWLGYSGWRWMLVLEAVPQVILGIVTFFYLTDRPKDARWLREDERMWITAALEREQGKTARKTYKVWEALRDPRVLLLAAVYFAFNTNSVSLAIWLPKIVQGVSGVSMLTVILITGIPWLFAVPAMLLSARHSDKTGERRWHTAAALLVVSFALGMSYLAGHHLVLAMAAFSVAMMALYSVPSPFWALSSGVMSGAGAAAAASVALINSVGNLGGFVGPYAIGFLRDQTGTYSTGIFYLIGVSLIGGLLVLLGLRPSSPDKTG